GARDAEGSRPDREGARIVPIGRAHDDQAPIRGLESARIREDAGLDRDGAALDLGADRSLMDERGGSAREDGGTDPPRATGKTGGWPKGQDTVPLDADLSEGAVEQNLAAEGLVAFKPDPAAVPEAHAPGDDGESSPDSHAARSFPEVEVARERDSVEDVEGRRGEPQAGVLRLFHGPVRDGS